MTLKLQQKFKIERHIVFTEKVNKISLRSNGDTRVQSNDSIEPYAHGTKEDLIQKKDEVKYINIIKRHKKD